MSDPFDVVQEGIDNTPSYVAQWTAYLPEAGDIRHDSSPVFSGSTDDELSEIHAGWTSSWELSCENGHVLLTSAGEENAEPFKVAWLDALGAGVADV